jgi:hypothetical protein
MCLRQMSSIDMHLDILLTSKAMHCALWPDAAERGLPSLRARQTYNQSITPWDILSASSLAA